MSPPWSPTGETTPSTTSSTRFTSREGLRSLTASSSPTTRSTGFTSWRVPFFFPLPRGVRIASYTNASVAMECHPNSCSSHRWAYGAQQSRRRINSDSNTVTINARWLWPRSPTVQAGSALLLRGPHEQLVDGHVARSGDDELDRLRDVLGLESLDRAEALPHPLLDLRPVVRGELGRDRAGLDQGDAHVPTGDLLAQRLAEGAHGVLGGVVDPAAVAGHASSHGRDVDEVGHAPRVAAGRPQQVRERGVSGVQQPLDVEVDHALPLLQRGVDDGPEQHHAGVVDHGVEPTELLHGGGHGLLGLAPVRDVGGDGERRTALVVDGGGQLLQA